MCLQSIFADTEPVILANNIEGALLLQTLLQNTDTPQIK